MSDTRGAASERRKAEGLDSTQAESQPKRAFSEPKLAFVTPKLARQGSVTELTGFFGPFSPPTM